MATLTIRPTGDSSIGNWVNQALGTTNLYQSVDESYLSESDYIQVSVIGASGCYFTWENHSTESGAISEIIIYTQAQYINVGDGDTAPTINHQPDSGHSGGTITLSSSSTLYHTHFATNPVTSVAWTWNNIDALLAGLVGTIYFENVKNYSYPRIYQMYIEVVYTPASSSFIQQIMKTNYTSPFGGIR